MLNPKISNWASCKVHNIWKRNLEKLKKNAEKLWEGLIVVRFNNITFKVKKTDKVRNYRLLVSDAYNYWNNFWCNAIFSYMYQFLSFFKRLCISKDQAKISPWLIKITQNQNGCSPSFNPDQDGLFVFFICIWYGQSKISQTHITFVVILKR